MPCWASVGKNIGQAVCGPKCNSPHQQISQDCTTCVDTYNAQQPLQCGAGMIPCLVTAGENADTMVCGPACGSSQQASADCSSCVYTSTDPPTTPGDPPPTCGKNQVPCFAIVGPHMGKVTCAPNCISPQIVHPDCSHCVNTYPTSPGPDVNPKNPPGKTSGDPNTPIVTPIVNPTASPPNNVPTSKGIGSSPMTPPPPTSTSKGNDKQKDSPKAGIGGKDAGGAKTPAGSSSGKKQGRRRLSLRKADVEKMML